MKCPHCGANTAGVGPCESCGKDLTLKHGVEIEYKDFKVSELLDIKLRKRVPAGEADKNPLAGRSGHKVEAVSGSNRSTLAVSAVIIAIVAAVLLLIRILLKF